MASVKNNNSNRKNKYNSHPAAANVNKARRQRKHAREVERKINYWARRLLDVENPEQFLHDNYESLEGHAVWYRTHKMVEHLARLRE